jgi:thymidylate kinase
MKRLDMRANNTPGYLITFCGLDGCGKTTMMKRLIADLKKEHNIFVKHHSVYTFTHSGNGIFEDDPTL